MGIAYRLPDVMVYLSAQEGLMKIPRSPRYRVTRRPKIMGVQIIGTDSNTREPRLVRQGSSLNKETGDGPCKEVFVEGCEQLRFGPAGGGR